MKKSIECNIQILTDAYASNNLNVICEFIKSARRTFEEGDTVCVFEDFRPDVIYRENLIFDKFEDFNKWMKQKFSMIDC